METKARHSCPVFKFDHSVIKPHTASDNLAIYPIPETTAYNCVINKHDWENYEGNVLWVKPDSLVNTQLPQFSFLQKMAKYNADSSPNKNGDYAKIKPRRFLSEISFGMLVPVDIDVTENANEIFDIHHYEPIVDTNEDAPSPQGYYSKYDVENFMSIGSKLFEPNELVCITEKIHGENWRCVHQGTTHVGSRTRWKANGSHFWRGLSDEIKKFVIENPGYTVYGEIAGHVSKFDYGTNKSHTVFVFDILGPNWQWLPIEETLSLCQKYRMRTVPVLEKVIALDFKEVFKYSYGESTLAHHMREGCVIRSLNAEKTKVNQDRAVLKLINPDF